MGNFIKENKIIIAVIFASLILGGFYYASQLSKQKSIEKQQTIKLQEERIIEEKKLKEKTLLESKKKACASEAEQNALERYKIFCTPENYCVYKERYYITSVYETAYKTCLQKEGLK
jgi:hypothetical protein